MPRALPRRSKTPHSRTLQEVIGVGLSDDAFDFVVINLEHDYELGLHLTMQLAAESDHPIVRAMYREACAFFADIDDLMTAGDMLSMRRARGRMDFPEPWEIRLGYTRGGSNGNGLRDGALGDAIFQALAASPTLRRVLRTMPDGINAIPQVGMDRVSDVLATICKVQLIEFTQQMAAFYNFDSRCMREVDVENCWDRRSEKLVTKRALLPVDDLGRVFLLTPKEICRSGPPFNANQYFRDIDPSFGAGGVRGEGAKVRMMEDAIQRPDLFEAFIRDRMRDSRRFRARKEFRPKKK